MTTFLQFIGLVWLFATLLILGCFVMGGLLTPPNDTDPADPGTKGNQPPLDPPSKE